MEIQIIEQHILFLKSRKYFKNNSTIVSNYINIALKVNAHMFIRSYFSKNLFQVK